MLRWLLWMDRTAVRGLPETRLFPSEGDVFEALKQLEIERVRGWSAVWIFRGLASAIVVPLLMVAFTLSPNRLRWVSQWEGFVLMFVILLLASVLIRFAFVYADRRRTVRFLRRRLLELGVPVCLACGYCLRGVPSQRCPECGVELPPRVREVIAYPARSEQA